MLTGVRVTRLPSRSTTIGTPSFTGTGVGLWPRLSSVSWMLVTPSRTELMSSRSHWVTTLYRIAIEHDRGERRWLDGSTTGGNDIRSPRSGQWRRLQAAAAWGRLQPPEIQNGSCLTLPDQRPAVSVPAAILSGRRRARLERLALAASEQFQAAFADRTRAESIRQRADG